MTTPTFHASTIDAEPTRALAQFSANTPSEAIPAEMVGCIEEFMLDFAGHTAYSSRFAVSSPAFLKGVRGLDPPGYGSTVVGQRETWSPGQAAMLNGTFAHTMDFDDTNVFGLLHPGAPVIPAALAVAEHTAASGRALLDSMAVGYEVVCRVGAALFADSAYDRGFHTTSVAGIFGAVAAAGRMRGLDAATIEAAFGLAGSMAAGSMQYLDNGAWNKRAHPGFAASNALIALSLAQAGVLGAHEAIAGRYGLLTGYTDKPRPHLLTEGLGTQWTAKETGIKPYPSCRLTHGAVDAALVLRGRLTPEARRAAALHIEISPKAFQIVGEPQPNKISARNAVEGQFSVYFQVAAAWLDGKVEWQSYERLGADDVEALTQRMTVSIDPALPSAGARLSVQGRPELTQVVQVPAGEPETPLGRQRLRQKFLTLAEPVYGKVRADELAERLLGLRRELSAADLVRAMRLQD